MQPKDPGYKPKTTIIQANPNIYCNDQLVVAWVIEDGQVSRAVTAQPFVIEGDNVHVSSALYARGAGE